ncbi:MAG: HTH domain-containing protein [Actinophytocola sp.]|uniref:hypothetical protein n=1 Tax=Actinophytocola sp. TaxID=1872138 RepID=UPI003C719470
MAAVNAAKALETQLSQLVDAVGRSMTSWDFDQSVIQVSAPGEIDRQVAEAVARCRVELLTVQPGGSRRQNTLRTALARDRSALERGARMRALYQHTARHDASTAEYVHAISDAGGEVRTFDELFGRLIIVDRCVAFLPVSADNSVAAMVAHPAVVDFLVKVFDHIWHRADPFLPHTAQNITTPLQDLMIRMLVEGVTGNVIAKRLGISERTLAKRIARLKQDYDALTHFQLGYRIALADATPTREG